MTETLCKIAVIPDKKPCDREGSTFVPKAMTITWEHPTYGTVTMSVEENDMNTGMMYWYTIGPAMWGTSEGIITGILKDILKTHPEAVVETNYKKWKDIAQ